MLKLLIVSIMLSFGVTCVVKAFKILFITSNDEVSAYKKQRAMQLSWIGAFVVIVGTMIHLWK